MRSENAAESRPGAMRTRIRTIPLPAFGVATATSALFPADSVAGAVTDPAGPGRLPSAAIQSEATPMDTPTSVGDLCVRHGIDVEQLAAKSGLDERRVRAIVLGRWTPGPQERDKIAAVFGRTRDEVAWGHRASVEHIQGHGPQFGRSP